MKKELDAKLVKDFPNLYKDRYASPVVTCLCFGFEHGDGWYDIIRQLSIKLEPIAKKTGMRAVQCKEKYGTLRFYLSAMPKKYFDEAHKYVDEAEEKSETTCEECGKEGKLHGKSWYYTRCEDCWWKICEERGYNDDEGELP